MSRRSLGCAIVLAILCVSIAASVSAQVRIVASGDTSQAAVGVMKDAFVAYEQRQAALALIAQDRASFVNSIIDRFSSDIAGRDVADRGRTALRAAMMAADAVNLYKASLAQSYDEMLDALAGSKAVVDPNGGPNTIGNADLDLVYTSVTPCRVLDTRFATGVLLGPWPANSTKNFNVADPLGAGQGGAAACGVPFANAKGVVLNITAVSPAAIGDLRIFPAGGVMPLASILNFSPGFNLANSAVVPMCRGCGVDISMRNDAAAVDVVVDIMGYFAAPFATALDCVTTANQVFTVAANANFSLNPVACPATYTQVSANCRAALFNTVNYVSTGPNNGGADCQGTNTTASAITMNVSSTCCRIPGR